MKKLRSLLMAFALLMMLTIPALAQGESVTLNFELTVSGEVPEGTQLIGHFGLPFSDAVGGVELTDLDGDGVYTGTAESPVNAEGETAYAFVYMTAPGISFAPRAVPIFPEDYETNGFEVAVLEDGSTMMASVAFGDDVQDDKQTPENQQDDDDKDTGAGKTPDNQQEDEGTGAGDDQPEDIQDDQQGEMPEEMPETGAGGLATGASVPCGSLGLMTTGVLAAGYAVLRRR